MAGQHSFLPYPEMPQQDRMLLICRWWSNVGDGTKYTRNRKGNADGLIIHWRLVSPMETPKRLIAMNFTRKRNPYCPVLLLNSTPLKYTNIHKFLWMILEKNCAGENTNMLKERCQKDLRLPAIISSKNFGADSISLRSSGTPQNRLWVFFVLHNSQE